MEIIFKKRSHKSLTDRKIEIDKIEYRILHISILVSIVYC